MSNQYNAIKNAISEAESFEGNIKQKFLELLESGKGLTRDEGNMRHFCVYFVPYNEVTKEVFIVHHKKSGLWLTTGGHIDKGETPYDAISREIKEELGTEYTPKENESPFLLTLMPINNDVQPCEAHYDFWYLFKTDGSDFSVDPREFHDSKWMTISDARQIVTDKANLEALDILERL